MITLENFINEAKLKLPYNFDIYNAGPKNKNFSITKKNIYRLYFKLENWVEETDANGNTIAKLNGKDYNQFIQLPLPAEAISYKEIPTKASTDNWTKIPEIADHMYAGAWYSDKFVEYNYDKYNKDWEKWLTYLKPFMHGKISATIKENNKNDKVLEIVINDKKFNEDRAAKISELSNIDLLKQWSEEADKKEKEEIEKRKQEEEDKKHREKAAKEWWDSLSDYEKMQYTMGYTDSDGSRYHGD